MKNIDRLAQHITKNGAEGVMIHTVPGTSNWLICQKIEPDKWAISLASPLGNVTYNLGHIASKNYINLWSRLIKQELENKTSQISIVKELRERISNFKKQYANTYKLFRKVEKEKAKKRTQLRNKPARSKRSAK